MNDEIFMKKALEQAKRAGRLAEVPVGAVIVKDGRIIARGYNRRETDGDGTAHAELIAIRRACKKTGHWRLCGCTLYVTLEPCIMCAGAIVNSRLDRVVIGTLDPKAGAMGSITDVTELPVNHKPIVQSGILAEECSRILKDFFKKLRQKRI